MITYVGLASLGALENMRRYHAFFDPKMQAQPERAPFDTATNTVSATIPIPTVATGIAMAPDGAYVYIAANDAIYEIATSTNTVTKSISVTSPNGTNLLVYPAVTPNGKYLYVPDAGQLSNGNLIEGNTVVVLNTVTGKLVGSPITVGNVPIMAAVTPSGKYAYISNEYDGTVSVIQIN
jgi:DNA-binding beta-propeller fold protein YncE